MSELAFNLNGEPFEVPPIMAAWRVRKLKPKGAPEVVYGRDGLPLFLPMDADIEDLRREARTDGRYRLDPVDDHNRTVPNAQASYVCVHPIEREPEPVAPRVSAAMVQADTTTQLISALLESQKQHTELARMYVSQFPVLANAMAGVVRSAGDVGLTARVPLIMPVAPEVKPVEGARSEDDDDLAGDEDGQDDETEASDDEVGDEMEPEFTWPRVVQTVVDHVGPSLGPLVAGIPTLGMMIGAKRGKTGADAVADKATTTTSPAEAPAFDVMAHVNATLAALTPHERAFAQAMFDEIPREELPTWLARLRSMSVPEAVGYVRARMDEGAAHADTLRAAARPAAGPGVASASSAAPSRLQGSAPVRPLPSSAPAMQRRDQRNTGARRDAGRVPAAASARATPSESSVPPAGPSDGQMSAAQNTQAHITAIQSALTASEDRAMRTYVAALSPADRAAWIATLLMLPVREAVATIRAQIADCAPAAQPCEATTSVDVPDAAATVSEATPRTLIGPGSIAPVASANPKNAAVGDERPAPAPMVPARSESSAAIAGRVAAVATLPATDRGVATAPAAATALPAEPSPAIAPSAAPASRPTNAHTHLAAIEEGLAPDERFLVQSMMGALSPDDREMWLDKLLTMSAAEGTAILRDALHELTGHEPAIGAPNDRLEPDRGEQPDDAQESSDGDESANTGRESADTGRESGDDGHEPGDEAHEPGEGADSSHESLGDGRESVGDGRESVDDGHESGSDGEDDEADEHVPASSESHASETAALDASRSAMRHVATPFASLPTLDPAAMARFKAIEAALTIAERMRAYELAAQLPPAELRAWFAELVSLPVLEVVATIRAAIAATEHLPHATTKGGGS